MRERYDTVWKERSVRSALDLYIKRSRRKLISLRRLGAEGGI